MTNSEISSEDDLDPERPFRFERDELLLEPDRCGLRLLTYVYQAFGLESDAIPPEFDRQTGRLVIPS